MLGCQSHQNWPHALQLPPLQTASYARLRSTFFRLRAMAQHLSSQQTWCRREMTISMQTLQTMPRAARQAVMMEATMRDVTLAITIKMVITIASALPPPVAHAPMHAPTTLQRSAVTCQR